MSILDIVFRINIFVCYSISDFVNRFNIKFGVDPFVYKKGISNFVSRFDIEFGVDLFTSYSISGFVNIFGELFETDPLICHSISDFVSTSFVVFKIDPLIRHITSGENMKQLCCKGDDFVTRQIFRYAQAKRENKY